MKTITLLTLAGLTAATPLNSRQLGGVGITANDLNGPCRDITFIFARGSTELGNMGSIIGPPVANGLRDRYGAQSVATQGVDYPAGLTTNFLPGGADPTGVRDMRRKLETAASKCPQTIIVAGGYSQGAATTHGAIKDLSQSVKDRIVGVVTFGDTQNVQDRGRIPNFPPEKTKIICNTGDLVCSGTLIIAAPHLTYGTRANEAVRFLAEKIDGARGGAPSSGSGGFGGFGGFGRLFGGN